jgi:hypothetical protein
VDCLSTPVPSLVAALGVPDFGLYVLSDGGKGLSISPSCRVGRVGCPSLLGSVSPWDATSGVLVGLDAESLERNFLMPVNDEANDPKLLGVNHSSIFMASVLNTFWTKDLGSIFTDC